VVEHFYVKFFLVILAALVIEISYGKADRQTDKRQ